MGEGGGGVETNFFLGQVSGSQTKSPDLLILDLKYFILQNLGKNSDFLGIFQWRVWLTRPEVGRGSCHTPRPTG